MKEYLKSLLMVLVAIIAIVWILGAVVLPFIGEDFPLFVHVAYWISFVLVSAGIVNTIRKK